MRSSSPGPTKPPIKRSKPSKSRQPSPAAGDDKKTKPDKSAFRVAVRCRPLLAHERSQESVLELTKGAVTIVGGAEEAAAATAESPRGPSPRRERPPGQTVRSFAFDHVYDEFCTQEEVYSQFVAPFTAQFLADDDDDDDDSSKKKSKKHESKKSKWRAATLGAVERPREGEYIRALNERAERALG